MNATICRVRDAKAANYFKWARTFIENAKFLADIGSYGLADMEHRKFKEVMQKVKCLPRAPSRLP